MTDHTATPSATEPSNAPLYWAAGALVLLLIVAGLVGYRGAKQTQEADAKAAQFIAALHQAGVDRLPSKDQVSGVLGADGGAVCQDPAGALRKATIYSMMTNGAAGPGARPIITDSRLLRGQLAVIATYCPEKLAAVEAYLDDLETDNVVRQ